MASLLKKKNEAAGSEVPAWHPNLRNFQRLPDTKVIRTAFFINVAVITVAAAMLLYVGKDEWQLHSYRAQIDDWQRQIDRDRKGSNAAIAMYAKYREEEAKLQEIDQFVKSKPIVSQLLMHLGSSLPRNMALDYFDLREAGLILRATVRGAPDQASGLASAYIDQLRADKDLLIFDEITPTGTGRNAQSGRVTIEVFLHLKSAGKTGRR